MTIVTAEGLEKKPSSGTVGNLQPPSFVGDPQQCVTAKEGTDITIIVELSPTGNAPTAISWRRGEQELTGDRYRVTENNNTVHLSLHRVTRDDIGHYTLTAKNAAGEARRAIEIKVEDAGSDVPVFLRRLSDLAVKVGTRTRFLVEIRSSTDIKVSWHRNDQLVEEGERFHFVHEGNFFCVDVAPVMVDDGGRWTCMAEGAGGRTSCSSHLNVLVPKAYKAPEFLEELQALLTEQGTVSLECKVVGVPTPVLHWYKDGKEIKAGDVFALTANPDDPTSLGTYTCEAVNCMGKTYSSSKVHVVGKGSREGSLKPADSMKPVGPPPIFKQELQNEKIKIGDTITLTCQVTVPPWPQSITWYNKEGRVEESEKYHVMADGLGGYMIEINQAEAVDEGEWKCMATSNEGARGISQCHVSMTYPKNYRKPRFLESLKAILTDEGLVSFECKVVGFPTPQLRWFKDGQELKPGDVYQLTGTNSLGSYSCIAKNCMGEATSSAELTVEDIQNQLNEEERLQLFSHNQPPKFIQGLKSVEAKIAEDFRFTVQVSISPEPSIAWYRDDEHVEDTDRYIATKETLGTCNLDIRALEIIDQAEWKCVATNDFGHSVTSCFLKLVIPRHFKKPRFLECLRAILSEEGAVNLECKVIGVPQPVLKWYKDGEELKPGDIHRIISGQDGTCCLGTYTCEAHNCMGIVASSASLLGFEERLMKGGTQQKLDQAGHMIARNPSLSTIHEERTSQMYDTPATERSVTVDERAEVSFSFDGKEVSVSLYETPDLTEEEALQVVEMYADQLSEHVSEHNVIELPPLRFVKETSNTGKLLREAVIIDVTHDAFGSAADDDLRTDADLEELSITEDNGQQAPPLPRDIDEDDGAIFEKLNTEFLERALAPTVPYGPGEEPPPIPKRPSRARKRSETRQESDTFHSLSPVKGQPKESDTFYSISPPKRDRSLKEEDDKSKSEHFTDAAAHSSELDSKIESASFASARGSSGEARAYQIVAIEEKTGIEPHSTKSSPPELIRNVEIDTRRKKDSQAGASDTPEHAEPKEISSRAGSLKKKMRSVESGLGRSFEESEREEKIPGELPGTKPERPARRGSRGRKERSIESGQGGSFEESGDSSEASSSAPKMERRLSHKKKISSEVGMIEAHMKKIQEQQKISKDESISEESDALKIAKPGEIRRSSAKERRVSTEVQTEGSITRKLSKPVRSQSAEAKESEFQDKGETQKKHRILSTSSVDLPTLQAAAEKSLSDKGEGSIIESLTRSLQDIQKGLASVEEQVKLQSGSEPGSAKSSLSVLEALSQPIEDSLALVEQQVSSEKSHKEQSPSKILETISQPIQEFQKGLALVEQQIEVEMGEESLLEKTSVSILENVSQPVQELQRDIALIQLQQQFSESKHEYIPEIKEESLPEQAIQPAIQTITQSIQELQRGIAVLQQHAVYEEMGEATSRIDSVDILETLSHPLHELRRGLAEVEEQSILESAEIAIGHSILEAVAQPLQELQKGLEIVEQQSVIETETMKAQVPEIPSQTALQTLAQPIEELQKGLAQIGQVYLIETEPVKPLPGSLPILKTLQTSFNELQHGIESISKLRALEETHAKTTTHVVSKLHSIISLAQPLLQFQKSLTNLEIAEFKSAKEHVTTSEEVIPTLKLLETPLFTLQMHLENVEKQILSGSSEKLASESVGISTVQALVEPLKNLKRSVTILQEISSSDSGAKNISAVETLARPLQDFTQALVQIEQQAVLDSAPKLITDTKSMSTAKVLTHSIQELQQTILTIDKQNKLEEQEDMGVKTVSKLADLAHPLSQLKQGLIEVIENIAMEGSKELSTKKGTSVAIETVVQPLESLQKELLKTERQLVLTMKKAEAKTAESVEMLLQPIQVLKQEIENVKQHASATTTDKSTLSVLQSLVQPLQSLQMGVTVVAPKESSLMVLENMSDTVEALQRGVASIEKKVLIEAKHETSRATVMQLGALKEPLKELQKELNLVQQKIQFEPEEELSCEVSSITSLRALAQPLQQLQMGLIQIEQFSLESDIKPLAERAAEVLVEPILELQRGIHGIQQQVVLEADEAGTKSFTILENLAQPLRELQRGLSVVEEQNIMILEEAPIFEKAASLSTLEKVTQSIQELHRGIAAIEHKAIMETGIAIAEKAELSAIAAIAKPLMELNKGLIQLEDQIFEPGEKPLPDRASILALETMAKPLQELTKGLAQIEEVLLMEPSQELFSERVNLPALETLAKPLHALQKGIAVVQYQTTLEADSAITEQASIFQTLAQPLQELRHGIAVIEEHVVMESSLESLAEKSVMPVYQNLVRSVEGIHKGIALIEKQAILEGGDEPLSEKTAMTILQTMAKPLKELQKNLAQVEQQVIMEAAPELQSRLVMLTTLATPVLELQRGIALIEEHAVLETGVEPSGVSAISIVQAIAQPIQEIRKGLVQIHEQVVLEAREEPLSEKTEISILKTLAKPIQQLQKSIAVIEQQAVLEPGEEPLTKRLNISVLETLAQPLKELHRDLIQVEQQVALEAGDRSISGAPALSILETIAQPVHELQRGIALIQQQAVLEAREEEMSDKSTMSMLKTLARPLQELQQGLLQVEQQIVMEAPGEPLSEKTEISLIKTLAQPIKDIQKSIAVIEQQAVYEPVAEPLSEVTSMSALKTLAKPLRELQKNLIQIEQQVALEAREQLISEASLSVLRTLAQPVQELQRNIAIIHQQTVLEAGDEDMTDRTSMSMLQTLAQPIEDLQRGIVEIQQQIALEAREEEMSDRTSMSILQAIAKPIQDVHRGIILVQEQAILEASGEPISDKTSMSALETLAQPVHELLKNIATVQQHARLEHGEELSERESISVLQTLAHPIAELHRGLVQIEQQVVLEGGVEKIPKEQISILETLAQPIQELQRGIALIEKQSVLEALEGDIQGKENISLLKTLAKPLQELQKGLVMIEQQEVMEAIAEPLSDDTNISELPTLASATDISQSLGVVYIEEQRALEGDVETLSDRTDPRELESFALTQQELRRDIAVVQQQTALDEANALEFFVKDDEKHVAHSSKESEMERAIIIKRGDIVEPKENKYQDSAIKKEGLYTKLEEEEDKSRHVSEKMKEEQETDLLEMKEEHKRRGQEEAKHVKGDEDDLNKNDELSRKGKEEVEYEKKEKEKAELRKKIEEEAERRKKEKEEAELRKQQEQELEYNKKETEEQEQKKQKQEAELRKTKEEEAEYKKKEDAEFKKKREKEEAEIKKKEKEAAANKKKEEAEMKKRKEEEKAECKKKEKEETDRKMKEEAELKKKKEEEEAESKKKEKVEADHKIKEEAEMKKKKEEKEAECRNKEKEEEDRKKKEEADLKKKNEVEEAERKKKEKEEADRKKKEEAELKKTKEEEEAERKKKEKEEADRKKKEEAELKKKNEEAVERTKKEKEEADLKKKEEAELKKKKEEEEAECKKKEKAVADRKMKEEAEKKKRKEEEEAELKKEGKEEADRKKKEEAELIKKKEEEEAKRKKKEKEDADRKKKEEAELKKKKEEEEAERRQKEKEEADRKKKEEAELKKKKEEEEVERKKKEKEEADRKMKEESELKKKKEEEEAERKKKEKEEADRKKKEEAELKNKKEEEEAERKKKEKEEEDRKKKEEAELKKKKEVEEVERKKKEKEEADRKMKEEAEKKRRKEEEEAELKKKEKEEADRKKKEEAELKKKKEEEEAERKKKAEEEADHKKKEESELKKKKEVEEVERKKKEKEEADRKMKEEAEKKRRKEEEEAELKKKEKEEADHKKKEVAELKKKKEEEEAELKKKKEEEEAERKKKEKEEADHKKKEEAELKKKKEEEEAERKKKEKEEADHKKKEEAELKKKKEVEEVERKKKEKEEADRKMKEEVEKKRRKEEEEAELKKKEKEEADHKKKEEAELKKKKEEEEAERKKKAKEEADHKKKEEAELKKKKEEEEVERKKKEKEEADLKKEEEAELKKKKVEEEAERKKKEKEEADRKMKEEAEKKKRKEEEESELKKKEKEEADRKKKEEAELKKKKEEEEAERKKKKEEEEAKRKKKEKEKADRKVKEEAELKKKKDDEIEHKKKEKEEADRKMKEEAELKKKREEEEAERKKKEKDEADREMKEEAEKKKRKEEEESELKKKEKHEADLKMKEEAEMKKRKEEEQAERKKKEKVEANRKKKEEAELKKKKEDEEAEHKKKEKEEADCKMKEEAEKKKRKEEEETECKKKEKEDADRKKKEETELKKKKEEEEAERKEKEKEEADRKMKEGEMKKRNEEEETERKKKEKEEADRKKKEQVESNKKKEEETAEHKKKEMEEIELRKKKEDVESQHKKASEESEQKQKEEVDIDGKLKEKEDAESKMITTARKRSKDDGLTEKKEIITRRRRSKAEIEEPKKETVRSRKGSKSEMGSMKESAISESSLAEKQPDIQWVSKGSVQRTRSFAQTPWTEEESLAHQRQYDDSVESTATITFSSSSSTLTPTSTPRARSRDVATEESRRVAVREKVESGPRDARKKPTFATRLTDRTAAQGSRIKLTCSIVGSPDPVVEWLKDGLPLVKEQRYKIRLEDGLACLEVINASPGDSAEYTCVARNLHGEATSSAKLKVFAGFEPAPSPPTFTRSIKETYRFSDDELILECRVRSHPPPKITWLKNGIPIEGSSRHQQSELEDGVCRLVISSPDTSIDNGQYTCKAENNVWSDQISTVIQFEGRESQAASRRARALGRVSRDARRPHLSNVLIDYDVPTGGLIALQVEAKGSPRLDVTWMKGSEPLKLSAPKYRTFVESGVYTLLVSDASEKDVGRFTCRVTNAYGQVDTSAAIGVVAHGSIRGGKPAMFINRPELDMSVAIGEDISVSFRVTGDPKPKVTWMKGIRDITNSQRSLKETMDDYVRLTLKRALVADAGTYWIIARNVYGCDRAYFTVTMRQRARSLTPSLEWNAQTTSNILRDIRDGMELSRMKDVPGPVAGEPVVIDCGRNWLTLSWPKIENRGGAPVLAYRVEAWPLGGDGGARWVEMGVSPINSFDAFNLKAGMEYKFRVTPRNRYGWGESVTTTCPVAVGRKVELPEFSRILPGQLKALQGTSICLECQVRGDPIPTVRWYRDGMDLNDERFVTSFDGSRCCQLNIQDLREKDTGRYMCEATNKVGRVSTFARLFVVNDPKILEADHKLKKGIDDQDVLSDHPPQFTMRLRDRRVQTTYPVRLTCQVAGRPTPELIWSKDGEELREDDCHIFWNEEHFHTLEINRTTLEDSGCYSATAKNANGAVSCRCNLVVDKGIRAYVAPEFLYELEPEYTVREGGELRLSAQVEAYPTVGVMWHRDGVRLRPSRHIVMTLDHDGTVELALAGVSARDAGVYSCSATNEVGRAETSTRVNVQVTETPPTTKPPQVIGPEIPYSKEPLFITKPRSTEAVEGDTVIILCEVVGDPKPEVVWLRDWLKPDYYRDAPLFRRVGDGPQYRLEIPRAKLDFTGAYSVIARNNHGEAKAVISLQIYAKGQGKEDGMEHSSIKHGKVQTLPIIRRELKDLRCCDGDAVTLECSVQATPEPDIRWEKGGRLLPLGGDFNAEFNGETARLHIHQVYPEDEGEYTCVAYNELGRALTSACLVVDVPEEKETLLSRQLSRPPGLLSAGSTPRSTPRTTPSRSKSPSLPRHREGTPSQYIFEDSRPRRLKVIAPKFYAVPHNRVAEEGETVRFQCAVAGHPTPWVTWDKDGILVTPSSRITISERDDLRIVEISEVTVEDAGFYRITLENEVGRVEASARLEVISRYGGRSRGVRAWSASPRTSPTFGRRLIGSAARVGSRLTLACDVRGSPTPSTGWYRNGELVVRSSRETPTWDGRTARLEFEELELEDAGMYTCVAENEVGKTRCSARLVVLEKDDPSDEDRQPPVFLQGLSSETVAMDGEALELQVRLQGTPPLDVIWVKDSVEIPDCEDFRYVDHGDGRFGLRLADVFPQDSGEYRCEAYNEHGDAFTSGNITVKEGSTGVQFSKRPTPVLASPGGTATFCARLHNCNTRPNVSWTVAGRPVDSSRYKVESEGDAHILHISPVELCDSGQVKCVARSGMSSDDECVATTELTVRQGEDWCDDATAEEDEGTPAILLRGPSDTTALRGDRVVLKATYVGSPHPLVRWLKAGHELSSGGRVTITTEDGVACLVIEDITADDSGKYVVSIENNLGADCHFASVAVEGPADPPAGKPSVFGDGTSVNVAWSSSPYDGGCMVTGYCVEMKREQDSEWQVVTNRCYSFSHMVAGLTPGEKYVFRVRAENAHGLSEASSESEPFLVGPDEEAFMPAFEPRVVSIAPGEDFKTKFEVLEELGKGRYGVVHKVQERNVGQKFAAKFVRCIKAKDREKVQEEIDIMNVLRHPKLLQLAAAFESTREVIMVMEYISGGELFERVVADDFTLTERDCILFMRQICEGVDYMHQNYVVHLDLKPENIMCHTRTSHQIKLIDFGLAQKLNPDSPVRVLFGTPEFIPPEIINYEPIGVESDMWSVGVICYVLLSGLSPFMGDNDAETFANITRADYDFDDEAFDAISQDAKDFISALLMKRKEKRLTAKECLQHTWLAQHAEKMSCVRLCTDKLKKFIIRRKWQKTGNAIRALGRMATLSAASRRNSNASSTSGSPRPSLSGCGTVSRMSSLNEEDLEIPSTTNTSSETNSVLNGFSESFLSKTGRMRVCSERSDSGISDCSSIAAPSPQIHCQCPTKHLLNKKFSITEEVETCSEKLSDILVCNASKSGNVPSGLSVKARAQQLTVGFVEGNSNNTSKAIPSAISSNTACSSSSAKYNVKKTDSLIHQSSVDSGVHLDIGTPASPEIVSGKISAKKKELTQFQQQKQQQKGKEISDKPLSHVSGIVQARSKVLSAAAAQTEETKPKSPTCKKPPLHHPPPISTSNEHSTNYQKAMAFWKR